MSESRYTEPWPLMTSATTSAQFTVCKECACMVWSIGTHDEFHDRLDAVGVEPPVSVPGGVPPRGVKPEPMP